LLTLLPHLLLLAPALLGGAVLLVCCFLQKTTRQLPWLRSTLRAVGIRVPWPCQAVVVLFLLLLLLWLLQLQGL
jgi:hypothetical protein